ncbi:kinase [Falsibacillus pallidus]|uniref:kinase n=1 Tax=Falsibacillus pallidus TaxID=493781 RepID=UPI003D982CE2
MVDNLSKIMSTIPSLEHGQRFVLGIDGLSRSGKTTLTNKVVQQLRERNVVVFLFHIDDYIVERKKRYDTRFDEWHEYYHLQWDVKWLSDHFFAKLKNADELQLLMYVDASDAQKLVATQLPETCVIIIEGVFLQRKEWRHFYDVVIFVDCPREKRFSRESEDTQGKIEKFQHRYWKAEDYYIEAENPLVEADLVIQN